jgi:cell division protein FtsZ
MSDAVAPLAGINEAFTAADQTLSQSIRAIARVVRQRGLVHIGFDELATALRGAGESGAHCVFGYGEADGDNRAHEALARALKSPLMEKGRMLEEARNILVNVAGGSNMTLNEVQILMEELNRYINDQTRLLFGVAVDPALGQKITVTIVSALQGEPAPAIEVRPRPTPRAESSPVSVAPTPISTPVTLAAVAESVVILRPTPPEPEPELVEAPAAAATVVVAEAVPLFPDAAPVSEPAPEPAPEPARGPAPAAKPTKAKPVQVKQEQMQFEPVTRGRFEKSEPTIVDGQDLDVPTFLRRNVKVR